MEKPVRCGLLPYTLMVYSELVHTGQIIERHFNHGTGLADHMWGEGLLGDVLEAWYWGKVDLADQGMLIYTYLMPQKADDANNKPYGRVFLIPKHNALPQLFAVDAFESISTKQGAFGLSFSNAFELRFASGGHVSVTFGEPLVEDWPFQVAGPSVVSVDIPGVIKAENRPGIGEYLNQTQIDAPWYQLLFSLLKAVP